MLKLEDPLTKLKNIGESRAAKLAALGIYNIKGLLSYYPRDYIDRSIITDISEMEAGRAATVKATVSAKAETFRRGSLTVTRIEVRDASTASGAGGSIDIVWYNQPYMKNNFTEGDSYTFSGICGEKFGRLQMEAPEYERAGENELLSAGRIVPVYRLSDKFSQKLFRQMIFAALSELDEVFEETLPGSALRKYKLCDLNRAVRNIHFPEDAETFFQARRRLVFEELLFMQLALLKIKGRARKRTELFINAAAKEDTEALLPFALTNAQARVLEEIWADFASGYSMNRLIQGDVGSGKTAVALIACFAAIKSGYQAALMAPTEVLAAQHLVSFEEAFARVGITTVMLAASLSKKEKKEALDRIRSGKARMIIGTHALIEEKVEFENLGLAITDEQHRFGVRQRLKLTEKGANPHILVMTATPIPRTLALILYGDLDIGIIDELPPGRKPVETFAVNTSYRSRIYAFIEKELAAGRQAYVICPAIEEKIDEREEAGGKKAAFQTVMSYTEKLKEVFGAYSVAFIHGKIKAAEKRETMDRFKRNEIRMLVSTTVIEVGINVPNASVMLIENAERFGLSQLHQLRGRVGRGADKSYCILVSDAKSKVSKERLKIMTKTNDGFVLSETDLKLRGQGDFFGTRQHGLPELLLANLYSDMPVLKTVQKLAAEIIMNACGEYDKILNIAEEKSAELITGADGQAVL